MPTKINGVHSSIVPEPSLSSVPIQGSSSVVPVPPKEPLGAEDMAPKSVFQSNGGQVAQETASPDAQFASLQTRPSSGTNILNLQIADKTDALAMSGTSAVAEVQVNVLEDVAAVNRAKAMQELREVPTVADLESLKSGDLQPEQVAAALKKAFLSKNPQVVNKAAQTLQVAESYARKAEQDKVNYAGTGFQPYSFPKLVLKFDHRETADMIQRATQTGSSKTIDILFMAEKRGLLQAEPAGIFHVHSGMKGLFTGDFSGQSAQLPGSDGRESPRGASSFREEWEVQVKPGLENIRQAIIETASVKGPGCPYARGNHAKGIAFDNVEMKLDSQAPAWAHELLGSTLKGGMIRVSGSQTDPNQPDQEAHMPGIRVVLPVNGSLDGSATQTIDITANTGSNTHAQTGAEHTQFTKDISVPKSGLAGLRPVRAAKHALGALFGPGKVLDRVKAMRNAVQVTDMAMGQRFHEHTFFGRHAFFVGGRYVQVRFEVLEPKSFPDPRQSTDPNARLNAVEQTVGKHGMKLAMYMTELPEGRPNMVEQEGWKGLPEVRLGVIEVPAQEVDRHSQASQWFEKIPHVPGGPDKVFHAAGLGRHRVPIYMQSGKVRNNHNHALQSLKP